MRNKNRDFAFDVARSICIVEIVCMLHMTNYLEKSLVSKSLVDLLGYWTRASLAFFTFMSGYFMGRYKLSSTRDVYAFMLNRIKRFWGLYFVASLLLYVASSIAGQPWYESFSNFLLSLLGLTIFFSAITSDFVVYGDAHVLLFNYPLVVTIQDYYTNPKSRNITINRFQVAGTSSVLSLS